MANAIGKAIYEKEISKITEAWKMHFSKENSPYIDYDGAVEGRYSNIIVKRMIKATIENKEIAGLEDFDNEFFEENRDQVQSIFTADKSLFISWLVYCNKNIRINSPTSISIPVDKDKMEYYASKIFSGNNHSRYNWGELYFSETSLNDMLMDWSDSYDTPISECVDNLDEINTNTIVELIKTWAPEDIVYTDDDQDEIDIETSLDNNDNDDNEIKELMRRSWSDATQDAQYKWLEVRIQGELEEYIRVQIPDNWSPWNDKYPLWATMEILNSSVENILSQIGDYFDLTSMDPLYTEVFYNIEDYGYASINTDRMDTFPDEDDYNMYLKESLPNIPKLKRKSRKKTLPDDMEQPEFNLDITEE